MRLRLICGLGLVIGFTIGMLAVVPDAAGIKIPPDFTFEMGKESPGPVTFSHNNHKEKVPKCKECHKGMFKLKVGKTGPMTMKDMEEGKLCGTCHNGDKSFGVKDKASCEKCHVKK